MTNLVELRDLDLRVPPISQHGVFETRDPYDNRACWYAAALMVLSHRGPLEPLELVNLRSLARLWKNHGVQPHHLDRLANEVGMELTTEKALFARKGAADYHRALSTLGPLMMVTQRHMIVVRGIVRDGSEWAVAYNDPFTGSTHRKPLLRFNGETDWRMPILYRRSGARRPLMLQQPVVQPYAIG